MASFAAIIDAAHRDGCATSCLSPRTSRIAKSAGGRVFLLDSIDPLRSSPSMNCSTLRALSLYLPTNPERDRDAFAVPLFSRPLESAKRCRSRGSFVAVTEDGPYLADYASCYRFRAVRLDPPDIRGRYSSLLHFALLAALWAIRSDGSDGACGAMRDLCQAPSPTADASMKATSADRPKDFP
jgi:hypothetical protein